MTFRPVISSQADLEAAWRFLMQPLGFSGESLWFMLVEPDGTLISGPARRGTPPSPAVHLLDGDALEGVSR